MFSFLPILLFLCSKSLAANCGTSTIPFSLEVLPGGGFVLGCARPTCFGWEGTTGRWATMDSVFIKHEGYNDGFLRSAVNQRPPFNAFHPSVNPQISVCLPSTSCGSGQWLGGIFPSDNPSAPSLICCSYASLEQSLTRGMAPVRPGEIVIGGEVEEEGRVTHFDYLRNARHILGNDGQIEGFQVEMGRMRCVDPPAIVHSVAENALAIQPQPAVPAQSIPFQNVLYQPQFPAQPQVIPQQQLIPQGGFGGFNGFPPTLQGYWCFAADSTVLGIDGMERRMDEISLNEWVFTPSNGLRNITTAKVNSWLHRLPEQEAEFVVITMGLRREIKLTPRHFIYKSDCDESIPTMVSAENVRMGDCLFAMDRNPGFLILSKVTSIRRERQKGIFAPLTSTGTIIVDGVAVSCFSEVSSNSIVQTLHRNFIECDSKDLQCSLKEKSFSFVLEMAQLLLPESVLL